MEISLRFSGDLVGAPESLEPLVRESEDDCFGHYSGRPDLIRCWPQGGLSCDAPQCLSLTELGAESAIFLSKNETQVQPGNARLLPGALDLGRDIKQASTFRWPHSEDNLKDVIKVPVFDEDDEAESEGSLWLSEENDPENSPRAVCTFRALNNGVSKLTTMSPHSAAWAITTRTQGGDNSSKEEHNSQSENKTHDTPQESNAPQSSQVRKRSTQDGDQDSVDGESADDNAMKKPRSTSSEELRLACPFNKMDPLKYGIRNDLGKKDKYRVCLGPGFPNIHRLREHLQRVHRPLHCNQCLSTFDNVRELDDHVSSPIACEANLEGQREGIDDKAWDKIRTRGRKGQTLSERWYEIWDILFPDIPKPSSCWYLSYDEKIIDPNRLVADFKERVELDISRGFIRVQDIFRENAQGAQELLVEWMTQALRNTIAPPEAHYTLQFSKGIPSTRTSDLIDSERAGSSKTDLVDLAIGWLDPKETLANAPVPFSEPDSSSEISSLRQNLFPLNSPASEILQPATSSKTPNCPASTTSTGLNHPWSLEAAHPETMISNMNVSEQSTHLQESFPSNHDVATEEQLEGRSSPKGLPTGVGFESYPSQSIAVRSSGSLPRYACSTCNKTFSRASDLRRHSLVHNPSQRFTCPIIGCNRSAQRQGFYRQDKLRAHMHQVHRLP